MSAIPLRLLRLSGRQRKMRFPISITAPIGIGYAPLLALALLAFGLAEYPHALGKSHVFVQRSYLPEVLLMALPAIFAFLVGWKFKWLERAGDIPPMLWIILAYIVILIPPDAQIYLAYRAPWHLAIPGLVLHVDAGLISGVIFLAWIASLKIEVSRLILSRSQWDGHRMILPLGLGWFWLVSQTNGWLLNASLLIQLLAAIMLRRSSRFNVFLTIILLSMASLAAIILTSPFRWWKFTSFFLPDDDPLGSYYAAAQIQNVLRTSTLFGCESIDHVPRVSDQFILTAIAEHSGWPVLGFTIAAISLFFAVTYIQISKQSPGWLQAFGLCIWGFLLASFLVSLLAALSVVNRPRIGIPFISHDFFLASLAAFITGIATKREGVKFKDLLIYVRNEAKYNSTVAIADDRGAHVARWENVSGADSSLKSKGG